jgi:hypothetical protein
MPDNDFRQWPTAESTGIDKGYEKDRPRALVELEGHMAGPKHPGVPEEGVKNPDGEFENPAPFNGIPHGGSAEGANGAGNSSGSGDIDPQGQQGGTHGGQAAGPLLPNEVHPVANVAERVSQDRKSQ